MDLVSRIVASALVLGLMFCMASAQSPGREGVSGEGPSIEEPAPTNAGASNPAPTDNAIPVRLIQSPVDTQHAQEREAKSDKHEADDLEAQRKAADAAERSAAATEWQIIPTWMQAGIAAIGTFLLLYTLWLTRKSLLVARDSSKHQLRAYVVIKDAILLRAGSTPRVEVTIMNVGETPAFIIAASADFFLSEYPISNTVPKVHAVAEAKMIIGRGLCLSKEFELPAAMSKLEMVALKTKSHALLLNGKIIYTDVFNEQRYSTFMMVLGGDHGKIARSSKFRLCEHGNETSESDYKSRQKIWHWAKSG
jgi:hypothetical protein